MSTYVHLSVKVAMLLTSHAAIIVININMSQVSTCVDYLHNYSCPGEDKCLEEWFMRRP